MKLSNKSEELLKTLNPDYEKIKRLLGEGADLNEIDEDEGESVFSSFVEDHHHVIYDLINCGAKATNLDKSIGGNPLIYAVWQLNYGLLRGLLEMGANPNASGFHEDKDIPMTALDAVGAEYHCDDDEGAHQVLDAMEKLLRAYGGKYFGES